MFWVLSDPIGEPWLPTPAERDAEARKLTEATRENRIPGALVMKG